MCGIFGTQSYSKFEILYSVNSDRGSFGSSFVSLVETDNDITTFNQEIVKEQGRAALQSVNFNKHTKYFIGHVQAPTSSERKWNYDTSHPFETLSWLVVHNGVLTNWEAINQLYTPWNINPVDTSVIPALLQHFTEHTKLEAPQVIKKVLELLTGTFAVCIVDSDSNDVYIARQGSVLSYNDKGDFSTLPGKDYTLLPEGKILMLKNYEQWIEVETFKTSSPFLFI